MTDIHRGDRMLVRAVRGGFFERRGAGDLSVPLMRRADFAEHFDWGIHDRRFSARRTRHLARFFVRDNLNAPEREHELAASLRAALTRQQADHSPGV
ncbi:MAG: hypothetical protein S0880_30845 [Actinomycetota bacterium]|nr:hypothetical protein [Actinomycetota bacterium]